jgi:hypothetical protein
MSLNVFVALRPLYEVGHAMPAAEPRERRRKVDQHVLSMLEIQGQVRGSWARG